MILGHRGIANRPFCTQGAGYRVQGTGYGVPGTGYRAPGTGYRVPGHRVPRYQDSFAREALETSTLASSMLPGGPKVDHFDTKVAGC